MTDLTPEALDQLESLARAATPGPWEYGEDNLLVRRTTFPVWRLGSTTASDDVCAIGRGWPNSQVNADYIAAADPATILALIAEVRRMRADWLREATSRDELLAKIERLRDACRNASQDDWGLEYLYVSTILRHLDGGAS